MQLYVLGFIWKIKTQHVYEGNLLDADHIIFKKVFWAFKPCIDGFKFCKSVFQVDGTFLYGKYRETLLVAVAQDSRNNILSIAFAILEGEIVDT